MRIVQLNTVPYGSTGKIMLGLAAIARENGHDVRCYTAPNKRSTKLAKPLGSGSALQYAGSRISRNINIILCKLTGAEGRFCKKETKLLLREFDRFRPDIIHLHCIHGWYVNAPMLFDWAREHRVRIVWTLHDCWPLTGHCLYFDRAACSRWAGAEGCRDCPQRSAFPSTLPDRSSQMFALKRQCYEGQEGFCAVAPSEWMAGLARRSILGAEVRVLHNGIDLSIFKPSGKRLETRQQLGISPDTFVVMGAAFQWEQRKGSDTFRALASRLPEGFHILLVGQWPKGIAAPCGPRVTLIGRTYDAAELAQLYSSADVFVNPTLEDNFPTVNIEALACGTPVITYDTGGSAECLAPGCGCAVPKGDTDALEASILNARQEKPYTECACTARAADFDERKCLKRYLDIYNEQP